MWRDKSKNYLSIIEKKVITRLRVHLMLFSGTLYQRAFYASRPHGEQKRKTKTDTALNMYR